MREIIIDRTTDAETSIVSVKIDEVSISESYFFDISISDTEINTKVNADLTLKEYP